MGAKRSIESIPEQWRGWYNPQKVQAGRRFQEKKLFIGDLKLTVFWRMEGEIVQVWL